MPELGRAALVVTLGLSAYALVAGAAAAGSVVGGWRSRRRTLSSRRSSRRRRLSVLLSALVRHDFSFTYVARTTSEALPTGTRSRRSGAVRRLAPPLAARPDRIRRRGVRLNRGWARDLIVWVVPVFAAVSVFFSFLLVAVASPFATQVAPPDGAGMTPSLQNPYMLAHPPLLYLGYVGLTVPFAFAMGALLSGQTDERWLVAARR